MMRVRLHCCKGYYQSIRQDVWFGETSRFGSSWEYYTITRWWVCIHCQGRGATLPVYVETLRLRTWLEIWSWSSDDRHHGQHGQHVYHGHCDYHSLRVFLRSDPVSSPARVTSDKSLQRNRSDRHLSEPELKWLVSCFQSILWRKKCWPGITHKQPSDIGDEAAVLGDF